MNDDLTKLCLLVPCYNESEALPFFFEHCQKVFRGKCDVRFLFVNDGSKDNTLDILRVLKKENPQSVDYLSFIGNFGHQKALMAGFNRVNFDFDYLATLDADLQHPPEALLDFIDEAKRTNCDVVVGKRLGEQPGFLKNALSQGFYFLFNKLSGIKIIPGASDFSLYTPIAVKYLSELLEEDPFYRGIIHNLGFRYSTVDYQLRDRVAGQPSYTIKKSLLMAAKAIRRYSFYPRLMVLLLGCLGIFVGIVQSLLYTYQRLFTEHFVPGQTDLVILMELGFGLVFVIMYIQIAAIEKIRLMLRNTPPYLIAESSLKDSDDVRAS